MRISRSLFGLHELTDTYLAYFESQTFSRW